MAAAAALTSLIRAELRVQHLKLEAHSSLLGLLLAMLVSPGPNVSQS